MPVEKYRYLKQSISLTGCGSVAFNRSRDGLQTLTTHLKAGSLEHGHVAVDPTCQPGSSPFLEATNRYFTPSRESSKHVMMDIPKEWDPVGILKGMVGEDLVFTDENMVVYTKVTTDKDGYSE